MNGLSSERETLIDVQDNGGTSLRLSSHIIISIGTTKIFAFFALWFKYIDNILKKLHSNTLYDINYINFRNMFI